MSLLPTVNRRLATPPLPRLLLKTAPVQPKRMPSIGLLGGSFNPAHDGHRELSLEALRLLDLDEIWWLVSPQNPLKPVAGMAPYDERIARARQVASHPRIRISSKEKEFNTNYTIDTIKRLTSCKKTQFVFLMGADNLIQLPKWRHWRQLLGLVPFAVFNRTPYSVRAMSSSAASALARYRLSSSRAAQLKGLKAPVWTFLHMRPHPASSTAIRHNCVHWWV